MNEAVRSLPAQNQSLKPNQMMVIGRLDRVTKFESKFDHIVTCAAPDEFSKPSVLRLSATTRLADPGEMIKCLAVFNGWPNNYEMKGQDGEKRTVYDARGFFLAVE